jgi:crotonobetainyl-CoA:carnitine CoA-transferase CaiB-like acyl-CoA transferase
VFATATRDEWVARLGPADCCVTPVLDMDEALAEAAATGRGMVVDTVLADGSPFRQIGVVPRLSATPGRVGAQASALGADTGAVLAELGYPADRVAELRDAGVT